MTSDIYSKKHAPGFVVKSGEKITEAVDFILKTEPDGASDLGQMFKKAGEMISGRGNNSGNNSGNIDVIYIGNGVPTWGVTDHIELRELAVKNLHSATFSALSLGKGANTDLLKDIAGRKGGRVVSPGTLREVKRFSISLSGADTLCLRDVHITGPDGYDIFPVNVINLFEGDEMTVLIRTSPGEPVPESITLSGELAGTTPGISPDASGENTIEKEISCKPAEEREYIAHRWAFRKIAHLTAEGADKDEIVELRARAKITLQSSSWFYCIIPTGKDFMLFN